MKNNIIKSVSAVALTLFVSGAAMASEEPTSLFQDYQSDSMEVHMTKAAHVAVIDETVSVTNMCYIANS